MNAEKSKPSGTGRETYHHGNLTKALVEAAIELIQERGAEQLSVREVAKRAGVSPGAPFRHFENKTALLTAVGEQTTELFYQSVSRALAGWSEADPLGALRAMGRAYLDWAISNPVGFRIISSRELVDFAGSRILTERNEELRATMRLWVERARSAGMLRPELETDTALLICRGYVYGVARMWCDGHLADWQGSLSAREAIDRGLDAFVQGLARSG